MLNGQAVSDRLNNERMSGRPWMVVLDANGDELMSSIGPNGNIGCPISPDEVDYFLTMIEKTSKTNSEEQLSQIATSLEEFAKRYRRD